MNTTRRVAIYLRVSTKEQTEGYSLDEQKDKLKAYCDVMSYTVHDVYIDPGYSGSNLDRPAIQQLIDQVNDFDYVLVYKLDRLSRSQKDTLHLIEDVFLPNDVNLISLSESFDTGTPFGRAMVGILSVFAQLERENIKDRMAMGKVGRAKEGKWVPSSQSPFGYDYVDGELIVNEFEAMQVQEAVQRYLSGEGINAIHSSLKEKYGSIKSSQTIYNFLFDSETHRGKISYIGEVHDGNHEALISHASDLLIKKEAAKRKSPSKHNFRPKFLLTGTLVCSVCGAKMFAKNEHGKHFYRCYSSSKSCKHMIKDPNCTNTKKLPVKLVEDIVYKEIDNLRSKSIKPKQNASESQAKVINEKLKDTKNQIKKLMDLYQFGDMPITDIRERLSALQSQKKKLSLALSDIQDNHDDRLTDSYIRNTASHIVDTWDISSTKEKRSMLALLIDHIDVNNGDMNISWRF